MSKPASFFLGLLLVFMTGFSPTSASSQESSESDYPLFKLGRKYSIRSEIFGADRDIIIRLPPDYAVSGRKYAVLVFLQSNGRDRFAMAAAALDYMNGQGQIPEIALVGIELPEGNFGLVPREADGGTESVDRYLRFLAEEVFPFVDKTIRCNGYSILYGASNSGIGALYALLSGRLPCQAYIVSSPMLGWSPNLMAEATKKAFAGPVPGERFLYLIASDDDFGRVKSQFPGYVKTLQTSAPSWLRWKAETRTNEGHVPEVDIPLGLRALFPDYNPTETLASVNEFKRHYELLSRRYGVAIEPPSALLFDAGFELVSSGEVEKGRELFEYFVNRYPWLASAHAGVGFAYGKRGDKDKARKCLIKALEIEPDNGWAKRLMKENEK